MKLACPYQFVTLEEIRASQIAMLAQFSEFCTSHSLTFALAYGSLIGAVRHNGFIPWDDDIDLVMPWGDYKKFCQIISTQHNGYLGRYRIADPLVPQEIFHHTFFMKIYDDSLVAQKSELKRSLNCKESVFVDVFPQISLPMTIEQAYQDPRIKRLYSVCRAIYNKVFSFKYLLLKRPCVAAQHVKDIVSASLDQKSFKDYLQEYHNLMNDLDSENASRCFLEPLELHCQNRIMTHNMVEYLINHKFESLELPIPQNYDAILREIYGDWKQLPPIEDQKPTHQQHFVRQTSA